MFGLYLSLKDNPLSARAAVWGASAALLLQAGIGFVQFARQSTAFLAPLGLQWPGALTPEVRGVSVVQLADGARWLRAYGTLPHPNMLGGLALVLLAGPAAWFLTGRRWRWAAGLAVAAGMALLALTFSRSAWLGCLAAAGVLVFHLRNFLRWRLAALAAVMALGAPGRAALDQPAGAHPFQRPGSAHRAAVRAGPRLDDPAVTGDDP